jgi:PAS domain S-box-containing protein
MRRLADEQGGGASVRSGLLIMLGPVLVVAAFATLLALLAGLFGSHPSEMLLIGVVLGAVALVAAILTVVLLYLQAGERSVANRALVIAEARVSGILESAMDAIIAIDQNQRVVVYNGAAEKVFQWPRGAVLGQPLDVLLPARFRAGHAGHVGRFGQTGVTSRRMGDQTVLVGLRAGGEEFPIEASISQHSENGGKLFTVILRDVTERRRAEEMLARSEERLRGILDSAMDAIITVDEGQRIVLFNAAAEQVFGCPRREAIGAPLDWFIPERFRTGHAAHVRGFGATGTVTRRMGAQRIVTGLRRSGEEFPIDASISQVNDGDAKFYTVILRDVTERVKAAHALSRSREELREFAAAASSVREQEKSRIARELHDELAQALTALKMDLDWLRTGLPSGADTLQTKLTSMQDMVDGTVAATRRISADLRPLMLDDLGLLPAVEWLVQNFSQRTGIVCDLDLAMADLDLEEPYATAVFRILQESLTNVARHAQASLVDVSLAYGEGSVILEVRDNGRGFAIADPRKPNSYGLMGLRERAYLLDGEVAIESRPGFGTLVRVTIPVAAHAGLAGAPAEPQAEPRP